MRRGEIWTAVSGGDYGAKPRPVLVIQDDLFDGTDSIAVILITSTPVNAPLLRVAIQPGKSGLEQTSYVMIDKIASAKRDRLRQRIGEIEPDDLQQVERLLLVFLGFAG